MSYGKLTKTCLLFLSLSTSLNIYSENIIFDLFQVLFDIPTNIQTQVKLTPNIEKKYVDILHMLKLGKEFEQLKIPKKYLGLKSSAPIFYAYQTGKMTSKLALKKITKFIQQLTDQNFFESDHEKKIVIQLTHLDFDINVRKKNFLPLDAGISLLKRCAAQKNAIGNKRHVLYLLSNVEHEMITCLQETYSEIFLMFNGIITSGNAGHMKPEPEIYQKLLDTYHLIPVDCIFIDDQQANIQAAREQGIEGILCKDFDFVVKKLEENHIIQPILS